ncbi:hypothetical protein RhiirB3_435370 [Rhizophagus irregularis]|nr:hypothetical protein RhiirB3_435370 [Rhizophagus irregularis]
MLKNIFGRLPELTEEIIQYFRKDFSTLYSCILINRLWCRLAIPLLWEDPIHFQREIHFQGNISKIITLLKFTYFIKYLDIGKFLSSIQTWVDTVVGKNQEKLVNLIYRSLLEMFIENEGNLYSFEVVLSASEKFGDYLENFGFGHSNSCDGYLKLKRQLLKLIMEYCTKIRYFDSGQVLPPKLEYLSLSLSFNNNLSDLEIFFKNSQNIFIKKLLIIYGPNYIIESLLFYIKEYIMKKERVKYLAITSYDGDYELFPLKDEVNEFKLHNIIVKKFYDSMIYIVVHIVL